MYSVPNGYLMEVSPDHPAAGKSKAVPHHRLVMECVLGRLLGPMETVHHRDGNRANNDPANLEVLTRQAHGHAHAEQSRRRNRIPLTETQVREALVGRTTDEAARYLGVGRMTLYRRFDHLLTKRRSPRGSTNRTG